MQRIIRSRAKAIAWLCTLVYFASYVMRINFTVMLVKVCSDMNVDKLDLAAFVTGLTVAYGAGQIVSGLIGDRVRPALLLTFGLCLAAACNFAMSLIASVPVMTAVWSLNGFAHALLWPPIVRLMSTYLTDGEYGYAAVRVSWGSSIATILLYLLCPALLGAMSWRAILRLCALVGLAVALVWALASRRVLIEPLKNPGIPGKTAEKTALPRFVYAPILLIMLGIIAQGVLRDGVTNWMPSYLLETFGLPEEQAIVVTVILAVFSMVSFSAFDWVQRRFLHNEVFCSAVIFAGAAACALLLWLICNAASVALSALLMALIVGCMHGVNLMLITVVPKRFAKSGRVSTYSGLLNACTYIGAALSTYGFAALAQGAGWRFTILIWTLTALTGCILCLAATSPWQKFSREYQ